MKPWGATIWGHTDNTCAADECDDPAEVRGLCDWHDLAETDRTAEQLMDMKRDER